MKHIPKQATQKLKILSFEDALIPNAGSADYDRSKWIYIPDFYSDYRYVLGTIGGHPLITIGINPSTASPENLDPTLKSVQNIASANGFDSFIMFNLYAQRATDPGHMDLQFNRELHEENMKAFRWVLEQGEQAPSIWAAWGAIIEKRDYLKMCLADMVNEGNAFSAKWYHAGKLLQKGHPHHPLYLKKDSKLKLFEINSYINDSGLREVP